MSDADAPPRVERRVQVGSRVGLHARPAALVAGAAARQPVAVQIAKGDGAPVDARSVLMLMSLGAGHHEEVVVSATGEGALEAVDRIADLVAQDLDEQ